MEYDHDLHAEIAGLQSIINGYRIEIEMIELKIKEIMSKLKTNLDI